MSLRHHHVRFGEPLVLDASPDTLHVIRAAGRGLRFDLPAGWTSVWLPLAGSLRLETADCAWELPAGQVQVWHESRLHIGAPLPAWWLGVAGPPAAWQRPLRAQTADRPLDLFLWEGPATRDIRRLLVRVARHAAAGEGDSLVAALCAALVEQQRDLHRHLSRCSGRTLRRQQQTLQRLLRVRHLIRHPPDGRLDVQRLARSASYSPCHLIRLHRDVFDETPSEYAARLRFDRAWRMVRDTRMPVCEITEVLGFESQSAFCRAFKHSFGLTATQLRRKERAATLRIA